jgi:hypothetical protein
MQLRAGRSLTEIVGALANRKLPAKTDHINDFWDASKVDGTFDRKLPTYLQEIVRRESDGFDVAPLTRLEVTVVPGPGLERSNKLVEADSTRRNVNSSRRSGTEDSSDHLPSRSFRLDRGSSGPSVRSLPKIVSIIDIDRLPRGSSDRAVEKLDSAG